MNASFISECSNAVKAFHIWLMLKKKRSMDHYIIVWHLICSTHSNIPPHTLHTVFKDSAVEREGWGMWGGGWRLPPDTPRVTELNKDWLFNNTEQSIPLRLTDSSLRLFHLWTTVPTSSRVPSSAPFHMLSWVEQGGTSKSLKYCLHIKGIKTIR